MVTVFAVTSLEVHTEISTDEMKLLYLGCFKIIGLQKMCPTKILFMKKVMMWVGEKQLMVVGLDDGHTAA